jgi:hypothetical protein
MSIMEVPINTDVLMFSPGLAESSGDGIFTGNLSPRRTSLL